MTEPAADPGPLPPEPQSEPVPVQRRQRLTLLLALGFVAVVVLAGAAALLVPWPWSTPARPNPDAALSARLDRLEAAQTGQNQSLAKADAAWQSGLGKVDQRLHALENKPPPPPPDLSVIQQQIAALGARADAMAERIDALDKTVHAKAAGDPTDAALALIALQIGDAVLTARPFAAEYQTFAALAHDRPELVSAAAPLAEAAKAGIASRIVLARELHALAAHAAAAPPPPADESWGDLILARLRGLVTIRRVDGIGQSPLEAAVANAEKAMAQGDLPGAVQALQNLSGSPAESAQPWLRMATGRLQVEEALQRLTTLLAARIGKPPAASASSPG